MELFQSKAHAKGHRVIKSRQHTPAIRTSAAYKYSHHPRGTTH